MGKRGSAVASRKRPASALVSIPGALCAEDVEVSLPPLSELQTITGIVEFRKRAVDLGLVIRLCDGALRHASCPLAFPAGQQ